MTNVSRELGARRGELIPFFGVGAAPRARRSSPGDGDKNGGSHASSISRDGDGNGESGSLWTGALSEVLRSSAQKVYQLLAVVWAWRGTRAAVVAIVSGPQFVGESGWKGAGSFSRNGSSWQYFGVGRAGNGVDTAAARVSSSCCGVNLAGRDGPFSRNGSPWQYFGVGGEGNGVDAAAAEGIFFLLWGEPGGAGIAPFPEMVLPGSTLELAGRGMVLTLRPPKVSASCCGVNLAGSKCGPGGFVSDSKLCAAGGC